MSLTDPMEPYLESTQTDQEAKKSPPRIVITDFGDVKLSDQDTLIELTGHINDREVSRSLQKPSDKLESITSLMTSCDACLQAKTRCEKSGTACRRCLTLGISCHLEASRVYPFGVKRTAELSRPRVLDLLPQIDSAITGKPSIDYGRNGRKLHQERKMSRQIFACPFYKHRPQIYNNQTHLRYRSCSNGFSSLVRIVEHLERAHLEPQNYCSRCNKTFDTEEALSHHRFNENFDCVLDIDQINFISLQQMRDLRAQIRKKSKDNTQKWESMFRMLFPNDPLSHDFDGEDVNFQWASNSPTALSRMSIIAQVLGRDDSRPRISYETKVTHGEITGNEQRSKISSHSSVTSESTIEFSSDSTAVESVKMSAALELYKLLRNHDDMQNIYESIARCRSLSLQEVENRFCSALELLSADLKVEAQTDLQRSIVPLISSQAQLLGKQLCHEFAQLEKDVSAPWAYQHKDQHTSENKKAFLDNWLKERLIEKQTPSQTVNFLDEKGKQSDYCEEDEGENPDLGSELPNLAALKAFLITSTAFQTFTSSLNAWAEKTKSAESGQAVQKHTDGSLQEEISSNTSSELEETQNLVLPMWDRVSRQWKQEIGWDIPWDFCNFSLSYLRRRGNSSPSVFDHLKLALERFTGEKWDWWPFAPPKRPLQVGSVRLEWTNPRWRSRWIDVSPSLATKLMLLYRNMPLNEEAPSNTHQLLKLANFLQLLEEFNPDRSNEGLDISGAKTRNHFGTQEPGNESQANHLSSIAHQGTISQQQSNGNLQNNLPAENSQESNSANDSQSATGNAQLFSTLNGLADASERQQAQKSLESPNDDGLKKFHILLCVPRGRGNLHETIISSPRCRNSNHVCDEAFFQALRAEYRKLRGFWRYWLFPHQFDHCHGWRFHNDQPKLYSHSKEYPGCYPYEIDPSPPNSPYKPTICEDHWYSKFYSYTRSELPCRCARPFLPWRSSEPSHVHNSKLLLKMPRRVTNFDLKDDEKDAVVWGLRAELRLSLVYVILWQLLLMAGGLAFYFYWLHMRPGDQQNAIVPWTVIIGTFLFFWTPLSASFNERRA